MIMCNGVRVGTPNRSQILAVEHLRGLRSPPSPMRYPKYRSQANPKIQTAIWYPLSVVVYYDALCNPISTP